MKSTSRGWAARLAATLGVVALSALTLVPTAQAADPTGNIDFSRTGSIIIHKSEQGGTGTGTPGWGFLFVPYHLFLFVMYHSS